MLMGEGDRSVGNSTCHQAYPTEFDPSDPHAGRTKLTPSSCPSHLYVCHDMHMHTYNKFNF